MSKPKSEKHIVVVSGVTYERVKEFRFSKRIDTMAEATREIIELGLAAWNEGAADRGQFGDGTLTAAAKTGALTSASAPTR
ncbi:hypothetical protein GCM10019059_32100 [Camelimonas fluminis]|uniref:Uncharacterized protein n=1 Tax=Camelimonas fluminis TaxID=1576911 RepID=A0ABV7UJB9_9HYPH|nr:hypothetical protein [Camelimonas fluminis]GHE69932.1 hypothetical protein GCM10019059_32100 [Camelimonas fluminis]